MRQAFLPRAVLAVSLALVATSSYANTAWKGTTSGNWSDTTNWGAGLPTVSSAILYNATSTGTLTQNQDVPNIIVAGINNQAAPGTAGANPISISGLGFTIDAGGIANAGATQDLTISTDVSLSATQTWTQITGRTLTVNGPNLYLSNSTNSHTLTVTIPSAGGTVNLDSKISDSSVGGAAASNLTFTSTGSASGAVVRISGSNTYTGTTDLNGRAFLYQIGSNTPFGVGGTVINDASGAVNTFQAISGDHSFNNPITMNLGFSFTGSNSLTLGGNMTSTQGRAITINSSPGANMVFNGDITMGASAAAAGTFTTSVVSGTATATGSFVFNGVIKEAAGVTSGLILNLTNGNGTAVSVDQLNGQNTYSGGTLLSGQGSTVQVGSSSVLSGPTIVSGPLGTGAVTFSNGTTAPRIEAVGGARNVANSIILSSNATVQGSQNITLSGSVTNSGGDRTINGTNTAATVFSGPIYLSELSGTGRTLTFAGAASSNPVFTVSGNIANFNGSGTAGNVKVGSTTNAVAATLNLSGTNTYTGLTTVGTGSLLNIASAGALSSSTLTFGGSGSFDNTTGGTLALSNNINLSGGSPTFVGTNDLSFGNNTVTMNGGGRTVTTTAGTLTVGAVGEDGTSRSLTKAGNGTLVLVGAGGYTSGTTISAGTLLANNSTGSATGTGGIAINGGTFGGTGAVAGAVTANSTAIVAPGSPTTPIAALATGALTLNAGSTFAVDMNSNASLASAADLLNANGALAIAATGALLSVTDTGNTALPANTKFTLISYSGAWNGNTFDTHPDDSNITIGANTFVLNYNDVSAGGSNFGGGSYTNAVTLTLTAVPEAGSIFLGAVVCLAVGGVVVGKRFFRSPAVEA